MNPAAATISEAMLHHYVFLAATLEQAGGQPHSLADAGWPAWPQAALAWQQAWLGRAAEPPAVPTDLATNSHTASQLYPAGGPARWQRGNDGYAAFAVIRQHQDTVTLHLAGGQAGQATAETWAHLTAGRWQPPTASSLYLGQTLCFAGRISELGAATETAGQVLPGARPLRVTELAWGGRLFDRPGLADYLALFYPDNDAMEAQAGVFLNESLPLLALAAHKVAHQYDRMYEGQLRARLNGHEQALAQVLLRAQAPGADTAALDRQLAAIAGAYGQFAADLGQFERIQQTVRVNAANLSQALAELPATAGPLAAWHGAVQRAVAQLQADEDYLRAIVQEAEVTLQTLQIRTDLERAELEEEENRLTAKENRLAERRNLILAAIGVILALGEFVSSEAAYQVLCFVVGAIKRSCTPAADLGFGLMLMRLLLAALGAGLIYLVWRAWLADRRR